jgi:hypothetical protein
VTVAVPAELHGDGGPESAVEYINRSTTSTNRPVGRIP